MFHNLYRGMNFTMLAPDAPGGTAAPAPAPADPKPADPAPGAKLEGEQAKPLSQAEVDAVIARVIAKERAAADKAVQEAIERGKAEGVSEATKLAKMSEEEKIAEARKKADEDEAKRKADYTARETALAKRELRITAVDSLREKGMSDSLAEFLDYSGAEACNASITKLEKAFRAEVQRAVDTKLKESGIPVVRSQGGVDLNAMTDEQYFTYQKSLRDKKG